MSAYPAHAAEERMDLGARQDIGQPLRPLGPGDLPQPRQVDPQHILVKEQQRRQRLVLRGRGHLALHREIAKEFGDFRRAHLRGMPPALKVNEVPDPVPIRLLGLTAVVPRANRRAKAIDETTFPFVRRAPRTPKRLRHLTHNLRLNKPGETTYKP